MSTRKWIALIAIVLAAGIFLCPRTPSRSRVDPQRLLEDLLAPGRAYACTVTRTYCSWLLGKRITRTATEDLVSAPTQPDIARLVRRNYTPLVEGEDDVAGRPAWVLRLKPQIKNRPWKQLWVDKRSHAILASRDWTCANRIKRSMKTLRLAPAVRATAAPIMRLRTGHISESVSLPRHIPHGYRLTECRQESNQAHIIYSDGLYSISLFYEFPSRPCGEQDGMNQVRDWGQGCVLRTRARRACVTVMADLPAEELRRVAASIE